MIKNHKKRLAVCLNDYSDNSALLEEAIETASRDKCPWVAIYIENDCNALDPISKQRLDRSIDRAIEAGAQIIRMPSHDVAQGIITAAELHDITHVIIGKSRKTGLLKKCLPTLAAKLLKSDTPFELQVITLETRIIEHNSLHRLKAFRAYLVSVSLIVILTGLLEIIQESMPEYKFNASIYNVSMVYLLAIVFIAVRFGFRPALLSSMLSFGLYNFFFITPFYHFGLNQISDIINFALFLSASIISVTVADAYKRSMVSLKEREFAASSLHDLSKDIAGSSNIKEVTESLGRHLNEIIRSEVVLFLQNEKLTPVYPKKVEVSKSVIKSAKEVYKTKTMIYEHDWVLYPMSTARNNIGVLAVKGTNSLINDKLIEALCYQVAIAIERSQLMQESEDIKMKHQRESLRSALLSSVSHDLKTPLVSIIGSLSSVRHMEDSLSKDERNELIAMAIEEAERLNQFITNILSMTKIESGDLSPVKQWVEPKSLFYDTIQRFSSELKNHKVEIKDTDEQILIHIDPVLFTQVIQNLLENAVKYTPEGSVVTLSYYIEGNKAILEYKDNGPGVPTQDHERVLSKFTRLENRDAKIAGTGLGLAICKAIVEIHAGTIKLKNNLEGQGLLVSMTLDEYKEIEEE